MMIDVTRWIFAFAAAAAAVLAIAQPALAPFRPPPLPAQMSC